MDEDAGEREGTLKISKYKPSLSVLISIKRRQNEVDKSIFCSLNKFKLLIIQTVVPSEIPFLAVKFIRFASKCIPSLPRNPKLTTSTYKLSLIGERICKIIQKINFCLIEFYRLATKLSIGSRILHV